MVASLVPAAPLSLGVLAVVGALEGVVVWVLAQFSSFVGNTVGADEGVMF